MSKRKEPANHTRRATATLGELTATVLTGLDPSSTPVTRQDFEAGVRLHLDRATAALGSVKGTLDKALQRKVDEFATAVLASMRHRMSYDGDDRPRTLVYSAVLAKELARLPISATANDKVQASIESDKEALYGSLGDDWRSLDPTTCWFTPQAVTDPDSVMLTEVFKVTSMRYSKYEVLQETIAVPRSALAAWIHAGRPADDDSRRLLAKSLNKTDAAQLTEQMTARIKELQVKLLADRASERLDLERQLRSLAKQGEQQIAKPREPKKPDAETEGRVVKLNLRRNQIRQRLEEELEALAKPSKNGSHDKSTKSPSSEQPEEGLAHEAAAVSKVAQEQLAKLADPKPAKSEPDTDAQRRTLESESARRLSMLEKNAEAETIAIREETAAKIAAIEELQPTSVTARPASDVERFPAVTMALENEFLLGREPSKALMKCMHDHQYGTYLRKLSKRARAALMRERRRLPRQDFDDLMDRLIT